VRIPEELDHVGKESYQDLVQHVRKEREIKSLRELVGMPENEECSFQTEREKKWEELKRKQKKVEVMLQQLKDLVKEGKDRLEKPVKKLEDSVCKALEIYPDAWIPKDTSLDELVCCLQVYVEKLNGSLKERKDISDITVLMSASGGHALQGILVNKRIKDWLVTRRKLLRVPNYVQFEFHALTQETRHETFTSMCKEDKFCRTVERLGCSAVEPVMRNLGMQLNSQNTEHEVSAEDLPQEEYLSTVKYLFVPIASFKFEDAQLLLSQEALKYLKAIELATYDPKVSENDLQVKCEIFFEKYGSHARKGNFHFGGIYCWKCYSKNFQKSQIKQLKDLQSEIVTASVRASYGPQSIGAFVGGDWSKLSANITGEYNETLKSQTYLHVNKIGGPQEVSDLLQWKNELVASSSTWSLIDCGLTVIPVWNIIQVCSSEFTVQVSNSYKHEGCVERLR